MFFVNLLRAIRMLEGVNLKSGKFQFGEVRSASLETEPTRTAHVAQPALITGRLMMWSSIFRFAGFVTTMFEIDT